MRFTLVPIGKTFANDSGFGIEVAPEYRAALSGLDGFSHVQVLWWFSECDNEASRSKLIENSPYKRAPKRMGIFATRSPERPNPIAASTARVTCIDADSGVISLTWIDAFDGTPVLDIKPYTPSVDRVENPEVPDWCAHWPRCVEIGGDFPWEDEFNF